MNYIRRRGKIFFTSCKNKLSANACLKNCALQTHSGTVWWVAESFEETIIQINIETVLTLSGGRGVGLTPHPI